MAKHAVYLAVIAALIIAIVVAIAKAVRANGLLSEMETRYGLKEEILASAPRKKPLRPYRPKEILKPRTMEEYDVLIEKIFADASLFRKQMFTGKPKHLAMIVMEIARATQPDNDSTPVDACETAIFVEYISAAVSFIRPSEGFVPNAVSALMSGCITNGVQNICRQVDCIRDTCPDIPNPDRIGSHINNELTRVFDRGPQYLTPSEVRCRETAATFSLAVVSGWLVAGGNPDQIKTLREAGKNVGSAYRIARDIRSVARAPEETDNWNFAKEYGSEVAERELERNLKGGKLLLKHAKLWTPMWEQFYTHIRESSIWPDEES